MRATAALCFGDNIFHAKVLSTFDRETNSRVVNNLGTLGCSITAFIAIDLYSLEDSRLGYASRP